MYAIVVYDVGERRVAKVCKYLRTVLQWMQGIEKNFRSNLL